MSSRASSVADRVLRRAATLVVRTPRWLLVTLVRGYQLFVSPVLGPTCRFYPSCSAYALEAVTEHGAVRGTFLAVRRLGRCHPWNPGGVDLVPGTESRHRVPPDPSASDTADDPDGAPQADSARGADQTTAERAEPHQRSTPQRATAA